MTNCRGTITVLVAVVVVVTAYASTWNHHSPPPPPPHRRRHALTVNVLCLASLTGYLGYVGLLCIRDTQ